MATKRSAESVDNEIRQLADFDLAMLRQQWRELYLCDAPDRISRQLLLRAVAYRLQEQAYGGRARTRKGVHSPDGSGRSGSKPGGKITKRHRIKPGTLFLREW